MTVLLLPESLPPARRGAVSQRRAGLLALLHAWRTPGLAPLLAVALAVVTGFAAFEVTFAQLVYRRFGLHAGSIAFLFAYAGLLAAVMQMTLVGRLSRRLGERRLLLVGLAGTAVGLLLIASQHSLPALIAVLPVLAFGQAMVMPSLSALVSHTAPGERQGETLGAYQATSSLARVLGPMAGQLALGHLGLGAPALTAAACAVAAAAIAAALPPVGPSRLE